MYNANTMTLVSHAPRAVGNKIGNSSNAHPVARRGAHSSTSAAALTAVTAMTTMMAQTVLTERATTDARIDADEATTRALERAEKKIEDLTALVTQQGAEIAALKQARTRERIIQTATIKELQRQIAKLAEDIFLIEKRLELIKPAIRYYTLENSNGPYKDKKGNPVDKYWQPINTTMHLHDHLALGIKTKAPPPPPPTELEEWLRLYHSEEWRSPY